MTQEPASVSALIAEWPTIAEYASDIGCGYEAARQMRRRESIAPDHWPRVIAAAAQKQIEGVTFEWLARQRLGEENPAAFASASGHVVTPQQPQGRANSDQPQGRAGVVGGSHSSAPSLSSSPSASSLTGTPAHDGEIAANGRGEHVNSVAAASHEVLR